MAGLMGALSGIESAELEAAQLRAQYGARAEAHCENELLRLAEDSPRRAQLRDIIRALRWTRANPANIG